MRLAPMRPRGRAAATRTLVELATLLALVSAPLVVDSFTLDRLGSLLLYALFAVSLDVLWGYGGLLNFGHAIFFGWAGYLFVFLTQHADGPRLPAALALLVAPLLTGAIGYLLGLFCFGSRHQMTGIYFSVITFGLAVTSTALVLAGGSFTGGQSGVLIEHQLSLGGAQVQYGTGFYLFALGVLVAGYGLARWFVGSRAGLVLKGIREDEGRVGFLGHDTTRVKRSTLAGSAVLAGVAGELFAVHAGIASPESTGIELSIMVCVWIMVGGTATLIGGVLGAIVLSSIELSLAGRLASTWPLIVAALLVGVVTFARGGVLGEIQARLRRGEVPA